MMLDHEGNDGKKPGKTVIGVVGPCGAGKTTLTEGLKRRGYRARAHAQARKLRQLLDVSAPPSLRDTKTLAFCVVENFEDDRYLLDRLTFWREQLQWLFGRLFIERTGSDQGFRLESAAKSAKWDKRAGFEG